MAIIEITGGPITHRYLMRKSKDELASLYMRLLAMTEQDAKDAERYRRLVPLIFRNDDGHLDLGGDIHCNWHSPNKAEVDSAVDVATDSGRLKCES